MRLERDGVELHGREDLELAAEVAAELGHGEGPQLAADERGLAFTHPVEAVGASFTMRHHASGRTSWRSDVAYTCA